MPTLLVLFELDNFHKGSSIQILTFSSWLLHMVLPSISSKIVKQRKHTNRQSLFFNITEFHHWGINLQSLCRSLSICNIFLLDYLREES